MGQKQRHPPCRQKQTYYFRGNKQRRVTRFSLLSVTTWQKLKTTGTNIICKFTRSLLFNIIHSLSSHSARRRAYHLFLVKATITASNWSIYNYTSGSTICPCASWTTNWETKLTYNLFRWMYKDGHQINYIRPHGNVCQYEVEQCFVQKWTMNWGHKAPDSSSLFHNKRIKRQRHNPSLSIMHL